MKILSWDEYVLAGPQEEDFVDTNCAQTCFLCIVQELQSTRAFLGHFLGNHFGNVRRDSIFQQLNDEDSQRTLRAMIEEVIEKFGCRVQKIIVRGGALWLLKEDDDSVIPEVMKDTERERNGFLGILSEYPLAADNIDIRWNEPMTGTRITYDGRSGVLHEHIEKFKRE